MKIKTLGFKELTVFQDVHFEFSPGLNVLIGANSTGKSHVLKAIYSIEKAVDDTGIKFGNADCELLVNQGGRAILDKLHTVFKPAEAHLKGLIRKSASVTQCEIKLTAERHTVGVTLAHPATETAPITANTALKLDRGRCPVTFIPSRDALALFEGFIAAYQNRELSLDETYYDLCVALSAKPLRDNGANWRRELVGRLEQELNGDVQLREGRFYVGEFEAHLVAEGLRKVAMIVQLARNGGLTADSAICWDEPESGLNPRLVKVIADLLLALAASGLQLFIATHDALLTQELSLASEYQTDLGRAAATRFFCLSRKSPSAAVCVQSGSTLAELDDNPILQEFAAHYDREQRLFYGGDVPATPGASP